jgi:hypothetical protein
MRRRTVADPPAPATNSQSAPRPRSRRSDAVVTERDDAAPQVAAEAEARTVHPASVLPVAGRPNLDGCGGRGLATLLRRRGYQTPATVAGRWRARRLNNVAIRVRGEGVDVPGQLWTGRGNLRR